MQVQSMTVSSLQNLCIYEVSKQFDKLKYELEYVPRQMKNQFLRIAGHRINLLEDLILLKSLVHSNVEEITLTNCMVRDEMLDIITVCMKLKKLNIGHMNKNVTFAGLSKLLLKTRNIETFLVRKCDAVDDRLIDAMVENCPKISILDLGSCSNIGNSTMQKIGTLRLTTLNISGTNITDDGIILLLEGRCIQTLTELNVCRCPVTELSVKLVIEKCKRLSIFTFKDTKFKGDFTAPNSLNLKQLAWTIL